MRIPCHQIDFELFAVSNSFHANLHVLRWLESTQSDWTHAINYALESFILKRKMTMKSHKRNIRIGYFHNNWTNFLSGDRRMKGFVTMRESMGSNGHVFKSDFILDEDTGPVPNG